MTNIRLSLKDYHDGILTGDRILLARALTLVESTLPEDQKLASSLLESLLGHTGNSIRIGITGVPGVGKSTFIEAFGNYLTSLKKKIAILTIDPSSSLSKGSILGDKTRMANLAKNKAAFIRPTSSGQTSGGVSGRTRESVLLCEAAGFEVIIIETVGVGQSEIAVRNMVDFFLLLMLAGAGDELQGMKKGIMEMADAIVITKADGDNIIKASEAKAEYQNAVHLQNASSSGWVPRVLTSSAVANEGIETIWNTIVEYCEKTKTSGYFAHNRREQNLEWVDAHFKNLLQYDWNKFESLRKVETQLKESVAQQSISAVKAAEELLRAYHQAIKESQ